MKFRVVAYEKGNKGEIAKEVFVDGKFDDAESTMWKLVREGYRPEAGFNVDIKDCK